ncbi:MAG: cohesin domain-containing protein [Candidatus Bathyarchaeia archaeon]
MLSIMLIIVGLINPGIRTVSASSTAKIRVVPSLIKGLAVGKEFEINVTVENVENLYGFDIKFSWNSSILQCISYKAKVPVEMYPEGILHAPVQEVVNQVDNVGGTYRVAYSSQNPAPPFSGSGVIFSLKFKVIGYGTSILAITSVKLADYSIPPKPIPCETYNGAFKNYFPLPAKLRVEPGRIIDATLVPCKNFTVSVVINGAYDLAYFEFWLSYNKSIVQAEEIIIPSPFTAVSMDIFKDDGKLRGAGLTKSASGNFTLASIKFHVIEFGASQINLYNITLKDSIGEPLTYDEIKDAYFNNLLLARIFISPSELINPELVVGSIFHMNVSMESAIDFYGYQYYINYDPRVLICAGVLILSPTDEVHYDAILQVNQRLGSIYVNVSYYPPAQPVTVNETRTIGIIYFQVKNYGSTIIDLNNIKIVNAEGGIIAHLEDGSEDSFFATLTADVAIIEITLSAQAVYPGKFVNVSVTACNVGDMTSSFNVTLYFNGAIVGLKNVFDLPPNNTITLNFVISTAGLQPCNRYQVLAVASKAQYEVNMANNELATFLKVKMLGDINGDGIIDIFDITAANIAYDSKVGDPLWNEEADLAPPWGIIDIFDLTTLGVLFGTQC